jgi:hypothetical protein
MRQKSGRSNYHRPYFTAPAFHSFGPWLRRGPVGSLRAMDTSRNSASGSFTFSRARAAGLKVMAAHRFMGASLLAATLALGACGGGGGSSTTTTTTSTTDYYAPVVELTIPAGAVVAGGITRIVAYAQDSDPIIAVNFYRLDDSAYTLLGTDVTEPFEFTTIAPIDGRSTFTVIAKAYDSGGLSGTSNVVSLTLAD